MKHKVYLLAVVACLIGIVWLVRLRITKIETVNAEPPTQNGRETCPIQGPPSAKAHVLEQQGGYSIRQLKIELAQIESDYSKRQQQIEAWYSTSLTKLEQWAKENGRNLDNAERTAYAWYMEQLQNTRSETSRRIRVDGYAYGNGYVSPHGYTSGSTRATLQGHSSETTDTYVVGNPGRQYQRALAEIRAHREAINSEFRKLADERQCRLSNLDRDTNMARWRIGVKAKRVRAATGAFSRRGLGEITYIGSRNGKYFVLMDNRQLNEGNWINWFTVKAIHPHKVVFEKSGETVVCEWP